MEYKITEKGKKAETKPSIAGRVLEYMQQGHALVNASELNYELQITNGEEILNMLAQGGYVAKGKGGREEGFSLW